MLIFKHRYEDEFQIRFYKHISLRLASPLDYPSINWSLYVYLYNILRFPDVWFDLTYGPWDEVTSPLISRFLSIYPFNDISDNSREFCSILMVKIKTLITTEGKKLQVRYSYEGLGFSSRMFVLEETQFLFNLWTSNWFNLLTNDIYPKHQKPSTLC